MSSLLLPRRARGLSVFILFCGISSLAQGQCVSLTTLGSASTQNFDTLSNVAASTTNNLTIPGWFMTESGDGARDNEQYAVDTGGSGTGDTNTQQPPAKAGGLMLRTGSPDTRRLNDAS